MTWRLILPLLLAGVLGAQTLQQAEALWRQRRFREANDAFRALVSANPNNTAYKLRWGEFFLERFNPPEAAGLFEEVLKAEKEHPKALLGLARVAANGFESKAVELATRALKADPKLVEAQELLAWLALEDVDPYRAAQEAQKALEIVPDSLDAMAILAAVDFVEDKKQSPWIDKILAKDPQYGKAFATVGHFLVMNRRYEEGIEFYRKAIALKPDLWSARSQLGVNLMRLGLEKEARRELETCYENGHDDSPTVNTLRLMDSYKNFVDFKTKHGVVRLHKDEAELLRPYFTAELDRAVSTFEKKYKIKLERPVQIEVYPEHEDFAVRTMGMPGLGALGVTFGYIVAMDSPSGRKPGSFHWASTLWHELSHVFVLAATNHRVPRWFTEGLAVHEETAISPDWGDRLDPQVLMAIKDKKLLPVSDLDRGFIRPAYPGQVVVSYFQAGRICDFIVKRWSYQKLLDMMHSFAANEPTGTVVEKHLGMTTGEFDKIFLEDLDKETKKTVEGFEEWRKGLKLVSEKAKDKDHDGVIAEAKKIRDLYPDYVEAGSVYEFLADAYVAKGDQARAIAEYSDYAKVGGRDPETIKKFARLLKESGRIQLAAEALERLNFVYPVDEELHGELGELYMTLKKPLAATREYRAAVAMQPVDPAAAYFNLARAQHAAGKRDDAMESLISALEAAPGFRPAQKLLLELSEGETKK